MRDFDAIRLVAVREAGDRLRNRAFVFGTLVVVVGVVASIVLPALLSDDEAPRYRLGVVSVTDVPETEFETAAVQAARALDVELSVTPVADEGAAQRLLTDGDLDAALVGDDLIYEGTAPGADLTDVVDSARTRTALAAEIQRLGLTDEDAARLIAPVEPVTVVDLRGDVDDGFSPEQGLMAFAATILLFLAIQINGNSLLTGAIEEKSSRVVEVLLGTLRPRQLLAGKLVAMTLIALAQVAVIVVSAIAANAAVGLVEIPAVAGSVVLVSTVMIAVGFVFYAAMYAVAGSMTPSIEDAQAIAGPLAMAVISTYFAVIFVVIPSPEGTAATVLTFLPPTAPFTIPARVALDAIPVWQVVVGTLVTLAGAVGAVGLGGRLYSAALLAGGKLTWREAWKAEPIR